MGSKSKILCVCALLLLSVGVSGQSYNMPVTGTVTHTLSAPGVYKIYDDGGPNGHYSNNCNGTMVLNVPPGTTVSGFYDTENSYDYLYVYDGGISTLPRICSGTGFFPTTVITSGVITLRFSSDGSVVYSGFELAVVVPSSCNDMSITVTNTPGGITRIAWSDISPVSGYDVTVTNIQTGASDTYNGVTSPLNISIWTSTNYSVLVSKEGCFAFSYFQTPAGIPWKSDDLVIPFCTEENQFGITYPAGTTSENVPFNNGQIGCLYTTPSPAWFVFRIDQPGNMVIEMEHSQREDIDFICWGPFEGNSKQDVLDKVFAGLPSTFIPHNTGDRCSYSGDWIERCTIRDAQRGEWYILLITNYSERPGNISFNKISGNATTTCDIIIDISSNSPICEGENLNLYVNNAPTGATFQWTGPNGFTSTSETPVITNATPAHSGIYSVIMTASGKTSEPVSITVAVNPKYTEHDTISIQSGESYLFGSQLLTTAGDYQHHFTSKAGCDSLVYLHLVVGCITKRTNLTANICDNDSIFFKDEYLNVAGIYRDTLKTMIFGCDSIVTLDLTVKPAPSFSIAESAVCLNNSVHLVFTGVAPFELDYTFNGTRQNTTITGMNAAFAATEAGDNPFIVHRFVSANGCSLGGGSSSSGEDGVEINGVVWATRNVDAPGTFTKNPEDFGMLYQWNRSIGWSGADPMINSNGGTVWDSSIPVGTVWETTNDPSPAGWRVATHEEHLKLLDTDNVSSEWTSINGINGRRFTDKSNGNSVFLPAAGSRAGSDGNIGQAGSMCFYWSSTQYFDGYTYGASSLLLSSTGATWNPYIAYLGFSVRCVKDALNGDDTEIITPITVHPIKSDTDAATICPNALPFVYGDSTFYTAGVKDVYFTSQNGCDSIVTVTLTVNSTLTSTDAAAICPSALPFVYGDSTFYAAGVKDVYFTSQNGCDSIVTVTLTVNSTLTSTDAAAICPGDLPFVYGDSTFYAAGVKDIYFISQGGCDSVVTVTLTVNPILTSTDSKAICPGDLPFVYGDSTFYAAGVKDVYFKSLQSGCDSIVTVTLTVNPVLTSTDSKSICANALPFVYGDSTFYAAGVKDVYFKSLQSGCDSIVTVTLTVNPVLTSTDAETICANALPFIYGDSTFYAADVKDVYFKSLQTGCDSIVTVTLTVNPVLTSTDNSEICYKDLPFVYGDSTFTTAGTKDVYFKSQNGCDSIVTVTLTVIPVLTSTDNPEICYKDLPFVYGDSTFYASDVKNVYFTSQNGCDSVVTVTLTVNSVWTKAYNPVVCQNDLPFVYGDSTFYAAGVKNVYFISQNDCDTVVTVTLTVNPVLTSTDNRVICEKDLPFVYGDSTFYAAGVKDVYFKSLQTGCDSVVTVTLTVNTVLTSTYNPVICQNDLPFVYGDSIFYAAGVKDVYFTSPSPIDCYSIVTVTLTVKPTFTSTDNPIVCQADLPFVYGNTTFYTDGVKDVYFTAQNDCDSIVTVTLTVIYTRPAITLTNAAPTVCEGTAVVLNAVATPAEAEIKWFDPNSAIVGTGETITVNPLFKGGNNHRSEYTYKVVASFCGLEEQAAITVYVDEPLPGTGEILGGDRVCEGSRTTLDASSYNADTYIWTSEDDSAERRAEAIFRVAPTTTTVYKVEMTRGQCRGEDRYLVEIASSPKILSIESIGPLARRIVVDENYGTPPFYYGVDSKPVDEYPDKYNLRLGVHIFRVVDVLGCESQTKNDTLTAPPLIFPLYFSPNGDGVNDTWEVTGLKEYYPDAVVTIFDRFGKKLAVLHSGVGWDGTYLGRELPSTDYWYTIYSRDIEKELVGHFTLLR